MKVVGGSGIGVRHERRHFTLQHAPAVNQRTAWGMYSHTFATVSPTMEKSALESANRQAGFGRIQVPLP